MTNIVNSRCFSFVIQLEKGLMMGGYIVDHLFKFIVQVKSCLGGPIAEIPTSLITLKYLSPTSFSTIYLM